ncbi:MAG: glycosyl hydrolase-related protein, partial [Mycobacterium leprae]
GTGLIVRFWNPADGPVAARVRAGLVEAAFRCSLDETRLEPLTPNDDGAVVLTVGPREVATVELVLPEPGGQRSEER